MDNCFPDRRMRFLCLDYGLNVFNDARNTCKHCQGQSSIVCVTHLTNANSEMSTPISVTVESHNTVAVSAGSRPEKQSSGAKQLRLEAQINPRV